MEFWLWYNADVSRGLFELVEVWWAGIIKNPKYLPNECVGSWQVAQNLCSCRTNVSVAGGQHKTSR